MTSQTTPPLAKNSPPFTIQKNVDRVLVPVIVRDKEGHIVEHLEEKDFQIFDNGKPRAINLFMIERRVKTFSATATNGSRGTILQDPAIKRRERSAPPRFIVLVFDDMHLSIEDMAAAKKAGSELLASSLLATDYVAVASLSGRTNSGLTQDHTKLQETITSLQSRSIFKPDQTDCPKLDYYEADLIENKHDQTALQDAEQQLKICSTPPPDMLEEMAEMAARRTFSAGQLDVKTSFGWIERFIHAMSDLPGQRTLILVSPGFLTITPESMDAESHVIDAAAKSDVMVSAMDARGVYVAEMNASDDMRGRSPRAVTDFRRSAMMGAGGVMSELADATGGTYFHGSNDLSAGLEKLADAPDCVYMLELSLDGIKQNGTYHRLKIKIDQEGVNVQARHGYFAPKPEKKK